MITVWCTFQFESWHCWLGAPEGYSYLRNSHRHMFHVRAEVSVEHDNRDVEFIAMKRHLQEYCKMPGITGRQEQPTTLSCEQIAKMIVNEIEIEYGARQVTVVTVSEDGENGATVERITD